MKGAIELREAIALTIAKVTDHSPYPDPPWLRDGPSMHSSPCLLFPVSRVASHPSPERHPQLARAYTLPLPSPPTFCPQTNNELEAQRVATEFAFRKRLWEMEKVYSDLKWQEKNVSLLRLVSWGLDFLLWDEEPDALPGSPGLGAPGGDQSLCPCRPWRRLPSCRRTSGIWRRICAESYRT